MTDRYAGFIVTLDNDLRSDDAQATLNALRMVKGVTAVEPVTVNHELQIARLNADIEWRKRIIAMIHEESPHAER